MNSNGRWVIFLDVASLFTSISLTETIDFEYQQPPKKQISITISGTSLEELLLKRTINVYFCP